MATTSPDNLRTPNSSDPYNLVPDLQVLANDVQSALVDRANSYRGTSAQRTAFSSAPTGTIWSDTNGSQLVYVKRGSNWIPVTPEDTGWVAQTVASGFTGTIRARKVLGLVFVSGVINGNLDAGNRLIGNISSQFWPSPNAASVAGYGSGNYPASGSVNTGGSIWFRTTGSTGTSATFSGVYPA